MHDAYKLKAGNNESIGHESYPPHITVVDNTGEALGTNSATKVMMVFLLLFFLFFYGFSYIFFKFKFPKNLEKQQKN